MTVKIQNACTTKHAIAWAFLMQSNSWVQCLCMHCTLSYRHQFVCLCQFQWLIDNKRNEIWLCAHANLCKQCLMQTCFANLANCWSAYQNECLIAITMIAKMHAIVTNLQHMLVAINNLSFCNVVALLICLSTKCETTTVTNTAANNFKMIDVVVMLFESVFCFLSNKAMCHQLMQLWIHNTSSNQQGHHNCVFLATCVSVDQFQHLCFCCCTWLLELLMSQLLCHIALQTMCHCRLFVQWCDCTCQWLLSTPV